jgi:hypothetical protein
MSQIDILNETRKVVGPGPDIREAVEGFPTRTVPDGVRAFGFGALAIGILALLGGFATDPKTTAGALLAAIVYFMGISQGGVMFAVIQTITLGRWGRPLKRISESFVAFLPIVYLIWVVFMLTGGLQIYVWTHEELPPHKSIYLSAGFFVGRQIVGMGFLTLLSLIFVRNSLRPDMGVAAEMLGAGKAPAWWGRITLGWKGREAEVEEAYQKNIRLAPVIVVAYFIIFSMFMVDAVMSLAPHWYANMFPAWLAVSSVWMTLSWVCVLSVLFKKWLGIDHLATKSNYHDLGKLMFALSIFWTYNLFAQILPIWYGNMPEETGYLMLRMFATPWAPLAKVVLAMCFLIPFTVLLSRGIKKTPSSLAGVGLVIITGVALERFMLVMPEVWMGDTFTMPLALYIGVWLGFAGAFVLVVANTLVRVPPVALTDPFMNPNPFDVHLHVDHGHGHDHAHGH